MTKAVYVLTMGSKENARSKRTEFIRMAIIDEIRLGRLTESNFDEWAISVEEYEDGTHLSKRRGPTQAELSEMEP